ncbi:MAG: type II toxin-antitoxin system VapC family toxin [Desulfobacteraceae bacterium]|jgi:predicted nucleic acid-binding protein|nr:MAG: type II toxin-antitoxin system VapC family toxin [Desulfobacteraceae bacterium]
MISVDTNIVVRLLTGDDPEQFQKAHALFEKEDIVITTSIILECEWVLRYAYQFKPAEIMDAFAALFGLPNVSLQEQAVISKAMDWHKQNLDFADAIHLAKSQDYEALATFDRTFIAKAARITDFPVKSP